MEIHYSPAPNRVAEVIASQNKVNAQKLMGLFIYA
jgi:hypothetical protein